MNIHEQICFANMYQLSTHTMCRSNRSKVDYRSWCTDRSELTLVCRARCSTRLSRQGTCWVRRRYGSVRVWWADRRVPSPESYAPSSASSRHRRRSLTADACRDGPRRRWPSGRPGASEWYWRKLDHVATLSFGRELPSPSNCLLSASLILHTHCHIWVQY